MTYKAIVREMIRTKAEGWVDELLHSNNIKHQFTVTGEVSMEIEKEHIFWDVEVEIFFAGKWNPTVVHVGGTADDMVGICNSCILDADKKNIIWMNVKKTREEIGIKEFKVA